MNGTVRLAQRSDIEAVHVLLKAMHAESGVFDFDEALAMDTIVRLTLDPSAGMVGVIDSDEGQVVATIGLLLTQGAWYTRDRTLSELWSFVHPKHRAAKHAKNLVLFSKQCAELVSAAGTPLTFSSVVRNGVGMEKKARLYARHVAEVGTFSFFMYNPKKQYKRVFTPRGKNDRLVEA